MATAKKTTGKTSSKVTKKASAVATSTTKAKGRTTSGSFLTSLYKENSLTENGALSNSTTGVALVDQFGKSGVHRGRDFATVSADQSKIWAEDKLASMRFIFYLRLITRKVKGFVSSESVQMGQGNKDEAFKRLLWIAKYHPETFYKNLWMIPVVGTWKDLFSLIAMDIELKTKAIKKEKVYELVQKGIDDAAYNKALVQKYLPQSRSLKKCTTERAKHFNLIAKELQSYFGWSSKEYRKFKSKGEAHKFQRAICNGLYDELNFNEIPGKALFSLANGKFLKNHGLEEKYMKWLETQPVAKFTGYVYEMLDKIVQGSNVKTPSLVQKTTIDKQFKGLIELAKLNKGGLQGNVWVAVDTSGSMTQAVAGTTAFNVCVSLGIYFAELNEGAFHNNIVMFDATSSVLQLKGDSFVDRATQICTKTTAWGSTDFQSVIDEIIRVRKKNPKIPIADYPQTLLVVSDLQFNPAERNTETNYAVAMKKLAAVGLPPIKIIWWDCTGRKSDFPSTIEDLGTYMVSGFDGSIITLICGGEKVKDEKTGKMREKTMEEKVHDALNQEVLLQINI